MGNFGCGWQISVQTGLTVVLCWVFRGLDDLAFILLLRKLKRVKLVLE
jgi:hypothetical protein